VIPELQEMAEHCLEEDTLGWPVMSDEQYTEFYDKLARQWPKWQQYLREEQAEYDREFS
jgi:hypothetical protein